MKQQRTIFLVSIISLMFFVIAAGTPPTWLIQRASAATPAPDVTTAPVQRLIVGDQTRFVADVIAQSQSVPILTRQNAPDIPQCREILNQDILDIVNAASEDPAEIFERNRRAHPHMIMMPPPLDCASKLWLAARQGNRASESGISPELLSLRQSPIENFFNLSALNASVGTNIDLANGVEGYQGENSISIDPNNPLHVIAFSNTFFKDSTPACQSPTGGTARRPDDVLRRRQRYVDIE